MPHGLWFEYAVSPIDLCAWTFGPWLVLEGRGTSLQEVGHWWGPAGFMARAHFLSCFQMMTKCDRLSHALAAMPSLQCVSV